MGLFDDIWDAGKGTSGPLSGLVPNQNLKKSNISVLEGPKYIPLMAGGFSPVTTVWNGIGTTGKIIVGAGGGYLLGSLFGGKKQEQTQSFAPQNPIQNTYTNTFSNQVTNTKQITGDWSSNIIYSSPGASIKKGNLGGQAGPVSPSLIPQVSIVPSQSASQQGSQGQGTDWATLAAIAGVVLVGYGFVTHRKGS